MLAWTPFPDDPSCPRFIYAHGGVIGDDPPLSAQMPDGRILDDPPTVADMAAAFVRKQRDAAENLGTADSVRKG